MILTPLYSAALALLLLVLSARVIRARRRERVALGIGSNEGLERRVRAHANFAEYVPFALLLLAMAEVRGAPGLLLHSLGTALVTGRAAHAIGVSRAPEDYRFRVGGMVATLTVIGLAAGLLVVQSFGILRS